MGGLAVGSALVPGIYLGLRFIRTLIHSLGFGRPATLHRDDECLAHAGVRREGAIVLPSGGQRDHGDVRSSGASSSRRAADHEPPSATVRGSTSASTPPGLSFWCARSMKFDARPGIAVAGRFYEPGANVLEGCGHALRCSSSLVANPAKDGTGTSCTLVVRRACKGRIHDHEIDRGAGEDELLEALRLACLHPCR